MRRGGPDVSLSLPEGTKGAAEEAQASAIHAASSALKSVPFTLPH